MPVDSAAVNDALERAQWSTFWLPTDVVVHDRPEVFYRVCPRDSPTLNAAVRLRAPAHRIPALVREVGLAHTGLRSRWQVPQTADYEHLAPALIEASYVETVVHDARGLDVSTYTPRPSPEAAAAQVSRVNSLDDLEASIAVGDAAFETSTHHGSAALQRYLDDCREPDGRTHRFLLRERGEAASIGALTVYDELGLGFLWGGGTRPASRGRGYYSAVVAARIAFAHRRGLSFAGVYAREDTSSPILAAQGFAPVGRMSYWERPARGAASCP